MKIKIKIKKDRDCPLVTNLLYLSMIDRYDKQMDRLIDLDIQIDKIPEFIQNIYFLDRQMDRITQLLSYAREIYSKDLKYMIDRY